VGFLNFGVATNLERGWSRSAGNPAVTGGLQVGTGSPCPAGYGGAPVGKTGPLVSSDVAARLAESDDLAARIQVLGQLRSASDAVRLERIPDAIKRRSPAKDTFYAVVQGYFDGGVRTGQLVDGNDLARLTTTSGFYTTRIEDLSGPRRERVTGGGFEMLHPRYLDTLSNLFFDTLDATRTDRQQSMLDRDFLTVVAFCLQLFHITKDGTGRAGEDFLSLLAAEWGQALTFSPTGYRGAMEGPRYLLSYRGAAQKLLFSEIVGNFYRFLGLKPPLPIRYAVEDVVSELRRIGTSDASNRLEWPANLSSQIDAALEDAAAPTAADAHLFESDHPYRYYAEFLAQEVAYFVLCLADPARLFDSVKARYPMSFSCGFFAISAGLGEFYQAIPERIGPLCDVAVARIEAARMGSAPRDIPDLTAAIARLETEDPAVGKLFRRELRCFLTDAEKDAMTFAIRAGETGAGLRHQLDAEVARVRARAR
jgi:hypothetical protein